MELIILVVLTVLIVSTHFNLFFVSYLWIVNL